VTDHSRTKSDARRYVLSLTHLPLQQGTARKNTVPASHCAPYSVVHTAQNALEVLLLPQPCHFFGDKTRRDQPVMRTPCMSHLITTRALAFQVKLTCHGPQAQALAMTTTHIAYQQFSEQSCRALIFSPFPACVAHQICTSIRSENSF
jgi:hypothetical protein